MNSKRKAVANYQTTGKYLENKKKRRLGSMDLTRVITSIQLCYVMTGLVGRRVDDIINIDSSKALDIVSY